MNFETTDAADFGRSLTGIGLNLLVRDVRDTVKFLNDVFDVQAHRVSEDFAIMTYHGEVFQLHADHTYHSHPLPSLLPESGPRGGGIEIRLFETDPDVAVKRAQAHDHDCTVVREPVSFAGHGLRECLIACSNGYAWIPSRRLTDEDVPATNSDA